MHLQVCGWAREREKDREIWGCFFACLYLCAQTRVKFLYVPSASTCALRGHDPSLSLSALSSRGHKTKRDGERPFLQSLRRRVAPCVASFTQPGVIHDWVGLLCFSCIFLLMFMLTELIVPARFVPFFRPDLKAKKATDSESESRQPGLFPHARLFSSVHGRNWMVARGGGRSLSPPPRSRPRPLGHRGDGDRRGREENELVREQMEQRWPRATPSIKRL